MRIIYALPLLLLCSAAGISGCSPSPQAGDVYEEKLTRQRVEIAQRGPCLDLRDRAERNNAYWQQRREEGEMSDGLLLLMRRVPVLGADSLATDCVAYERKAVASAPAGREIVIDGEGYTRIPYTELHILSRAKLERRFTRID